MAVRGKGITKHSLLINNKIAGTSPERLRKIGGMATNKYGRVRPLGQEEWWEKYTSIRRLCAPWREEYRQAFDIAPCRRLQLLNQETVVQGGFESAETGPLDEASPRGPPLQELGGGVGGV